MAADDPSLMTVDAPSDDGSASSSTDSVALSEIANNGAMLNQVISSLNTAIDTLQGVVMPVDNGGTGLNHVGTGDLLYGSAPNVYSLLPDVATGNALISGGVNTAPSWGKIGLTTHVTGTLPIANGGTNKTSFTTYAVICGGTTTTGALQSVASVGTAGQFLISNGAGALPTFQTFTDGIGGVIAFPTNGTQIFWLNSPFTYTITTTTTRCTSGTCTMSFAINGVTIGGSANSVSTSQNTQTHTTSNTVAVGDDVAWTVSSNSSCVGLSFMVTITRP